MRARIRGRVDRAVHPIQCDVGSIRQSRLLDLTFEHFIDRAENDCFTHVDETYSIVLPPLTLMTWPVTNEASAEAR